ncbi:MAG: HAMP domain-containing histidine kinase [Pyrinomonadaceae bacterium]|nr:HAMP domain-containing histidine kinase [Pyrinomonadaceae bacterium]
MRAMFDRVRRNWLVPGCVAVLLFTVIAGVLQYRWINFASDAHRRQGREAMEVALRNFSGDFRETLLQLPPFFRPPPDERNDVAFEPYMIEITRRWHSTSDRPQLLASIAIGTRSDKGVVFRRLQTGDDQFKTEAWPNEFVVYRRVLEERLRLPGGRPPLFPNGLAYEFFQGRPVLIFPLVTGAPPTPEWQRPGGAITESPPSEPPLQPRDWLQSLRPVPTQGSVHVPELRGWCFLEVDNDYLRQYLLPELVERHYGTGARYQVAVVASYPLSMIYGSDPTLTIGSLSQVDAGIVLLDANMQQGHQGPPPTRPGPKPFVSGAQGLPLAEIGANRGGADDRAWLLVVKNKAGSLEALVENARLHILGFSLIMLVLLAGSSVMLMLATVRARRLAQQQMEFVAGVSHELRTPLTVIQSTSYNLSQGTIQDPSRVQQYGDVIQREARRLINQIERMLSFAGIQSGRRVYDPQPTNVTEIAERSLAEYAVPFAEDGWQIEQHFAEDLPLVVTDGPALESSLKNLFENVLKYAARGKWLSVTACAAQDTKGREVQITVADRGPGIAPKDLPHIFEPFYRGQNVAATTSGAGLGLCLVERNLRALGGRVTVQSAPGDGTSFTLHLPVS